MIINEVMPAAADAGFAWIELTNIGELPVEIAAATLTDLDDNNYTIPSDVGQLASGAFVLLIYDGAGAAADDYAAADDRIELHTPKGLIAPFALEGDQLAVFWEDDGGVEQKKPAQ